MKKYVSIFATLAIATVTLSSGNLFADEVLKLKKQYTRPASIPFPESNPHSKEKEKLGKILYFDPRLSKSGTQSCATCHNPSFSWEDGMPLGVGHGHKILGRATPTILNLAWDEVFFWDGRAETLEQQALGPIESGAEMAMNLDKMIKTLENIDGYEALFKAAFPNSKKKTINKKNVAKAIATYERTIISAEAPFDRWVKGDETAISPAAKRGFILFNKKANCAACHSGWNFSDSSFHDIGLKSPDKGRGAILKNIQSMQFAFKTVGLRNITKRAPYMHDGSMQTLKQVIDHYDTGFIQRESLSDEMKVLNLSAGEKNDLIAFLNTLESNDKLETMPTLPR